MIDPILASFRRRVQLARSFAGSILPEVQEISELEFFSRHVDIGALKCSVYTAAPEHSSEV